MEGTAPLPDPGDAYEAELVGNVAGRGWDTVHIGQDARAGAWAHFRVLRHPLQDTGFAYTVGLWPSWRHPELIVTGQWPQAREMLANAAALVEDGAAFVVDDTSDHVLQRFPVRFGVVSRRLREALLTYATWMAGELAPALQLILPDGEGRFPEEALYDGPKQPLLSIDVRQPLRFWRR